MILKTKSIKRYCHAITCALALSITPAYADESAASAWAGLSVGLNLSHLDVASDISFVIENSFSNPNDYEAGIDLSLEYMAPLTSNILLGVELMASHNNGNAEDSFHYNGGNIHIENWRIDAERSARILGKLALAATPTTLFYAGAGIERVHFSFSEHVLQSGTTYNHSDTLLGHVLAVGIDQRLSETLSMRAELSHTEMDQQLYQGGIFQSPTWIDPDVRALRIGIRYHF